MGSVVNKYANHAIYSPAGNPTHYRPLVAYIPDITYAPHTHTHTLWAHFVCVCAYQLSMKTYNFGHIYIYRHNAPGSSANYYIYAGDMTHHSTKDKWANNLLIDLGAVPLRECCCGARRQYARCCANIYVAFNTAPT